MTGDVVKTRLGSGRTLDADFEVEDSRRAGPAFDIVLRSRSGGRNSPNRRNPDYFEALEEILRRLAAADATILNIEVDSTVTRSLPEADRRLDLVFPIELAKSGDLAQLRKRITSAQRTIGRAPGVKSSGGNNHKQIRMTVSTNPLLANFEDARKLLEATRGVGTGGEQEPAHFLYPISETSKYSIGGDEQIDDETFLASAERGETSIWRLATNYRQIHERDFIWAYFTRPQGLILSVGRVVGEPFQHEIWNEWAIRIRWDRLLSQELSRRPVPYSAFEQRIWSAAVKASERTASVLNRWLDDHQSATGRAMDRDVEMVLRTVKTRQGQAAFRRDLIAAQRGRCAVTGCAEQDVLQAAHIKGVSSSGRHSVKNGLLLRADIHTLFDKGLLVIDKDFTVCVDASVADPHYRGLDGTRLDDLAELSQRGDGPTQAALKWHRQSHEWE